MSNLKGVDAGISTVTSTTGFGLPTTTGRTVGDLHYEKLAQREYVLTGSSGSLTWTQSAGSTSTVSAGLPSFNGRVQGDMAYDTTTLKTFVLTGLAAGQAGDGFSRADAATLGTAETGQAYAQSGNAMGVVSQTARVTQASGLASALLTLAAPTAGASVQATVHQGPGSNSDLGNHYLTIGTTGTTASDSTGGFVVDWVNSSSGGSGVVAIFFNGANVAQFGNPDPSIVLTANETATFRAVLASDNRTLSVYKGNTLIGSVTASSPVTGTKYGFGLYAGTAPSQSYLDDFSVVLNGSLAWTQTVVVPAGDVAATHYQGAWNATATYLKNDVVTRTYALYVALSAVPANQDPTASPSGSRVGAASGDVAASSSTGVSGNTRIAWEFTVNATTLATGVELAISTVAGGLPAGAKIGIATGVSTATTAATFLASHTTTAALAAGGFVQVLFDAPVTLTPGTTYSVAVEGVSVNNLQIVNPQTAAVLTGVVASQGNVYLGATAYNGTSGYGFAYRLDGNQQYFQKIADASLQEPVNTVASSGAAVTLPDVDTAALHRITLTANTTITLPSPAPGKSLTLVLVQDGPSPAAPTGLTATAVATGGTFAAATYFWKVTALNAAGESLGSNEATVAIAANGSANLAWTAVTGATGYKVYRSTTAGAESTSPALVATLGAVTSYTDTGTATTAGAVPTTATTGGRTVTFATPSGTIKFPGGAVPTITPTAGKQDVLSFLCTSVDWLAFVAGQNF